LWHIQSWLCSDELPSRNTNPSRIGPKSQGHAPLLNPIPPIVNHILYNVAFT